MKIPFGLKVAAAKTVRTGVHGGVVFGVAKTVESLGRSDGNGLRNASITIMLLHTGRWMSKDINDMYKVEVERLEREARINELRAK